MRDAYPLLDAFLSRRPSPGVTASVSRRPSAKRRGRTARMVVAGLALLSLLPHAAEAARMKVREGVFAVVEGRQLTMEAVPLEGEGLLAFSERMCGTTRRAANITEANQGRSRLLRGVPVAVPFSLLRSDLQRELVEIVFAADRTLADGWEHEIMPPSVLGRASLWAIADWFTGQGENYREIRAFNNLADDHLEPGQRLVIPARLLRPALREKLPPSSPYYLEYGEDDQGAYAIYRLKPGEALYSSVVARFTGQVFSDDVNALAGEIAARNGIRDVRDIPVDFRVKIPFDELLPEFLPPNHPRRRAWEHDVVASSQYRNRVYSDRLKGITVILDAGHGGRDVGAMVRGVSEAAYTYDVMVRVKHLLETTTGAEVYATTRDGGQFEVNSRDSLVISKGHRVMTDPPYPIVDSAVGVNLRWYLANSVFRKASDKGDPEKVVFLSLHMDALHSSMRGLMVYIPSAALRRGSYGKSGAVYASRREYKEQPRVNFSQKELAKSEGLSRQLASSMISAFQSSDLAVHKNKPVRDRIVRRRGRSWVPAVLRYNQTPVQALLELANLENPEDRAAIQKAAFRQRLAEAIVQGLLEYYGDPQPTDGVVTAQAAP